MIRFLYDCQVITLADAPADLTVLDWLRLDARRPGTKEGCASGDCGACTAVMGVPIGDGADRRLEYRAFNTCITLIGALDGRQLITVEQLADGDTLHPVQQAMVAHHASQCGFCTPGFVMSLFALWHREAHAGTQRAVATDARIEQHLGGNLCRCTGYRPILDAARDVLARPADDRFVQARADTLTALDALATPNCDDAGPDPSATAARGYLRPTTLDALLDLRRRYPHVPLVGGTTDLALDLTQSLKHHETLIAIGGVAALDHITVDDARVRLGAGVSLARLQSFFAGHLPSVGDYLLRFAAEQVRGQATLGGNLGTASPIGDLPPVLLALDADIELASVDSVRSMPLADFFRDYRKTALAADEIIAAVEFDLPAAGDGVLSAYKVSKRTDDDISTVAAAFRLTIDPDSARIDEARLAFGGMAAIPRRALAAEAALTGRVFDEDSVASAMQVLTQEFSPLSDARASAAYRLAVAANLLRRCYLDWQDANGLTSIARLLATGEEANHG